MKLNPYLCSELRMVPDDYHAVASQMECIKGGATGGMQFTMKNVEYFVKGWHCDETAPPNTTAIDEWVTAEKARVRRMEPQIK
jgi:hypothetical protein